MYLRLFLSLRNNLVVKHLKKKEEREEIKLITRHYGTVMYMTIGHSYTDFTPKKTSPNKLRYQ